MNVKLPTELLNKMVEYISPLIVYRDYRDEMDEDGVKLICEKGRQGYWDWQSDFTDSNIEYVWEVENEAAKTLLKEFHDELREWVATVEPESWPHLPHWMDAEWLRDELIEHEGFQVSFELHGYLNNHKGYLTLTLKGLEHDYQGWRNMTDAEYEYVAPVLTAFKINPRKVALTYDLPLSQWPNYAKTRPDEGELVKAEDLFTAWDNWPYGGNYFVMLDRSMLSTIANLPDMDDLPRLKLLKGARIIGHDYMNGASSLDFELKHDWLLPKAIVGDFYDDGQNRYGIQSCCGFVGSAWESEIEIQWPPVKEMMRRWNMLEVA